MRFKDKRDLVVHVHMDNTTAVACQSYGRNKVTRLCSMTKNLWDWCLQRHLIIVASHIPGKQNVGADLLSRSIVDRHDWMLDPTIFQAINSLLGSSSGGLVCVQDYQTASTFFQLETRPTSRGSGCIQADMDGVYGICKPSMGANWSLCTVHPSAGCNDSANHPIMARSAMVPNSVSSFTGQSEATSSVPRPANEPSGSQNSTSKKSQSVGCMVHLRQSY